MTGGKISVVIPVFRTEKYLEKCIVSVLSQTYENIEVILVDDGSDDNCGAVCDAFSAKDGRIKVIHKKNGGLSSARNAGLEKASGEYIAFVDSDDYVDEGLYESLIEGISDSDISVCAYYSVSGDKKTLHDGFGEKKSFTKKEALFELFRDDKIKNHVWNKLFRKELFDGVRFPEGKTFEDILTTYRLFEKSEKITYVPYAGYYYVERDGAISKAKGAATCFSRYGAHLERYEDIKKRIPESEGELLRQLFIQARAFMLSSHEDMKAETEEIMRFFTENKAHILSKAPLNAAEKKQVGAICVGDASKIKNTELFRKAEKLFKKIF